VFSPTTLLETALKFANQTRTLNQYQ